MIQYVNNDNEFGRALPAASPFDPDSPVIALINAGHDDADRLNAALELGWHTTVNNWLQTILQTGTTPPVPIPPKTWRFRNAPLVTAGRAISGGTLVQDGPLVGEPPKPPAPGVPPVQIVAGGTDPVLLQVRDGLAAMWPLLQRIAAALKV